MKNNNNNWLLMIAVGVVSASVALLFAPKSGKLLRADIKAKGLEVKDTFNDSKDNLVGDFKEAYFEAERDVEREWITGKDNWETRLIQLRATYSAN